MKTIAEKAKELEYLKSVSFTRRARDNKELYVDVYRKDVKEYSPDELEPRGNMIRITITSQAPMIFLKDKVHKIIKKNRIDADAFTWRQCTCGLETVVQLYKTKGNGKK